MNSSVLVTMSKTIVMTMPKTSSNLLKTSSKTKSNYDYDSFWSLYSFSQVPTDDWDDFSFFQSNRIGNPIAPLPLQLASVASGCRFLEDAQLANMNRMTKELNRKFQAIYDEMMQKKELERELAYQQKEEQDLKTKVQAKEEPKKQNFHFFENRKSCKGKKNVHRDSLIDNTETIAKRHSEKQKKKNTEKKVLDKAREQFFSNPSLIQDDEWLISIGNNLGMKNPSHNIREIKDKLNVSTLEKVKLNQVVVELDTVESSEEVTVEKEEEKEILKLTSTFIDTFELAEKQRKQEEKEIALMTLQEEETKNYNKAMEEEISKAHREFLLSLDAGFVVVGKNGKTIKSKKEEVPITKIILGASTFEKPKINKICRSLKINSDKPCNDNFSCPFLHDLNQLEINTCQYKRCAKVKEISQKGDLITYVNIDMGCKFIHRGETRESFFVREGFLQAEKKLDEKKEKSKEKSKGETVWNCNAWKESNPKIYTHPEQKACIHEHKHKEEIKEEIKEEKVVYTNTKTKLCESVSTGNPCRHKNNCRFAHSLDEINIPECPHRERCGFVKNRRGVFYNSEGKFCRCIHPEETRENYFSRNRIEVKKPEYKPEPYKFKTKICNSVLNGSRCQRRHCDYAHNEEELNIRECTFSNCKLVHINRYGVLVNVDLSNRCSFFHKGETKKSFFQRLTY